MPAVCVAFKAHLGWVNAVAVKIRARGPEPVHAERVVLAPGAGRDVLEPYHVAGGWSGLERVPRPPDPAAVVARGRRKQAAAARRALNGFRNRLTGAGLTWQRGVVLTGRGRLSDDLEAILRSHSHIHVAEGEAVRDATRAALASLGIPAVDQDEKRVPADAKARLGEDGDRLVKGRRPAAAPSWTREERVLALAAWLHRGAGRR